MTLFFYIALMLTVFLLLALLLAPVLLQPSPAAKRILEMVQSTRPDKRTVGSRERMVEMILAAASGLRARFGLAVDDKLKQRLLSAGIKKPQSMNAYSASRIIGPLIGVALGSLIRQ